MTLRKIAGLLAAFGLTVGLIGGGVGAVFQDQVTATENISVGKVACEITSASPAGPNMVISTTGKSVTYTPPIITSSAPNATGLKFDFTVKNTGTIPANFTVDSPGTGGSPFATYTPAASGPNPVAPGASISYTGAGVTWGDLSAFAGTGPYSFTWKVDCVEVPATQEVISSSFNFSGTGWAGWNCPTGTHIVSAALVGATNPYILGLAKPGETTDGSTYPVYPHYTFPAGVEGAVVHNGGIAQTAHLVLQCTLP